MSSLFDTKSGRRRSRYFREKGLDNPPSSQEERLALARIFFNDGDHETAYMLFDRIMDYDHPEFLNLVGVICASDSSPFHDLEAAEKYFRRAFKYAEEGELRLDVARNLVSTHANGNNINLSNIHRLFSNSYVADATLELIALGHQPELFKFGSSFDGSLYFTATTYASGRLGDVDHQRALALYDEYFEEQDTGYIAKLYQNRAIRAALGIGEQADPEYARDMIKTARVLIENGGRYFDSTFTEAFDRFVETAISSPSDGTLLAISDQLKRGLHPYGFVPITLQDGFDSNIYARAAFLTAYLAQAENWKQKNEWIQISRGASKQVNDIDQSRYDFTGTMRLDDISRFHPEILKNGEKELVLRKKRLAVHEYFKTNDLGMPPLDAEDRRQLAIKFMDRQPADLVTAEMLFDEELDDTNHDWLLLMGHIRSYQGRRTDAFSFYRQASKHGSGEGSYRAGLEYESSVLVNIDLDQADAYFRRAIRLGFDCSDEAVVQRVGKYAADLDKVIIDKAARDRFSGMYKYFRDNGLGVPPVDQEERRKFALDFINMAQPNYEAALMLFDEEIDNNHSDWLLLLGFIHNVHINNEKFFNPEKAIEFYKKSSALGNWSASSNLGLNYEEGKEVPIDLDKAMYWYDKAKKQGGARAAGCIADIKLLQRSLDNPSAQVFPNNEIAGLYLEGAKKGDLHAWDRYALCLLNGTGLEQSKQGAINDWLSILKRKPQKHEEHIHASISYRMAVRLCFGLGIDRDVKHAISLLDGIPLDSNNGFIKHQVQEWRKGLADEINHGFSVNELQVIQDIYNGSLDIGSLIKAIEAGEINYTAKLKHYVAILQHLSEVEKWPSQYGWNDLSEALHARQLGFTFKQAVASTLDGGPRYNPLDNRGLPILGVLQRPSFGNDEEEEQRQYTGSYVPQPGMQNVKGILGHEDGFKYTGDYSEDLPAIITEEDRHIAEILVFGDPDNGPIYPSLSLERENNDEYGKGAEDSGFNKPFSYKIFKPQWLAYTDFGRTLWITDYLIGQWCWRPEKFRIGTANDDFPAEKYLITEQYETAAKLIRDIRLTGGRDGGGANRRVMIQPSTRFIVPDSLAHSDNQRQASVKIKQMTMKVFGSYMLGDNRNLFKEDPNFKQGRTVKKLTDRYNVISQLDPRFTRAQQLMALLYGHLRLHEIGYRPSPHLQEELTFKLRAMQSLGRDKDERLVVRHKFGNRPCLQGV